MLLKSGSRGALQALMNGRRGYWQHRAASRIWIKAAHREVISAARLFVVWGGMVGAGHPIVRIGSTG